MRTASQIFYLAVFSLLGPSHALVKETANAATRSMPEAPAVCAVSTVYPRGEPHLKGHQLEPKATVSDACATYDTLDALNAALTPSLKTITQSTDFFGYYRLNLFDRVCPFWNDANSMCGNIACAVNTIEDEKDIPLIWRQEELSKLEGPKAAHPGRQQQKERGVERPLQGTLGEDVGESCVVEYDDECDDRDYCIPEDESASAKGDYVSLVDNKERFTGYGGQSAHMVWDAIYKENCFSKPALVSAHNVVGGSPLQLQTQAAADLRHVLQANAPDSAFSPDDSCLEKRVFYRIISGMHASISTHICHDYLNKTTGEWGPNLQCFHDRLAIHPDRISNLYFNYALVTRAVAKLRTYLKGYTFCSGDSHQDADTKTKVLRLADQAASGPVIFDETQMFQDPAVAGDLKEDFKQRFRNVSRLMDCVGCDKCRLWGKLQTVGYGTALKVLFEYDENKNGENPPLRRTELVALVNTLDRISSSLSALQSYRNLVSKASLLSSEPSNPVHLPAEAAINEPESREDDGHPHFPPPDQYPDSIWESITGELNLVWTAFKWVMNQWMQLPKKISQILLFELARVWAFWLGLQVPEREYGFIWGKFGTPEFGGGGKDEL